MAAATPAPAKSECGTEPNAKVDSELAEVGDGVDSEHVAQAVSGAEDQQLGELEGEEEEEEDLDPARGFELGTVIADEAHPCPWLHDGELNWSYWGSGKVGGRPSWLNPRDLPSTEQMKCSSCGDPMALVLQLYAPVDEEGQGGDDDGDGDMPPGVTHDGAFHRALYVFACRHGECLKKRETKLEGASNSCGLRVLRCQLPAKNDFYAEHAERDAKDEEGGLGVGDGEHGGDDDDGKDLGDSAKGQDRSAYPPLCALCGAPGAAGSCSQCHGPSYCCKEHQRRHWREGHRDECQSAARSEGETKKKRSKAPFVFPQFEVVISPEPGPAAREAAALAALGATRVTTDVSKVRL